MKRVKVCAISYINTIPFVYGIKHADENLCAELLLHTPSECVRAIEDKKCDIAIVPVASLLWLNDVDVVSNYSISATSKVRTVELLSNTPLNEITDIYLDEDSRTSALLVRILCAELWHIKPTFHSKKYDNTALNPKSGEAYLMIGDKVFGVEQSFKYNHDLATAWEQLTGLPFVFALWVARKGTDIKYLEEFNKSLSYGVGHITEAIDELSSGVGKNTIRDYLSNYIEYSLTEKKRKAVELFLAKAALLRSKEFSSPN